MALTRMEIDGYGQLELNNCAFRRDGRIEAQVAVSSADFSKAAPMENGMILAIDKANSVAKKATDKTLPVALNYTSEHMYDERKDGLKDFSTSPSDDFLPRFGYLSVGDAFTTNCVCFDIDATGAEYTSEDAALSAVASYKTSTLYGTDCSMGAILVTANSSKIQNVKLKVVKDTTVPDGQKGIKFQVIG